MRTFHSDFALPEFILGLRRGVIGPSPAYFFFPIAFRVLGGGPFPKKVVFCATDLLFRNHSESSVFRPGAIAHSGIAGFGSSNDIAQSDLVNENFGFVPSKNPHNQSSDCNQFPESPLRLLKFSTFPYPYHTVLDRYTFSVPGNRFYRPRSVRKYVSPPPPPPPPPNSAGVY